MASQLPGDYSLLGLRQSRRRDNLVATVGRHRDQSSPSPAAIKVTVIRSYAPKDEQGLPHLRRCEYVVLRADLCAGQHTGSRFVQLIHDRRVAFPPFS